MWNGSRRWRAGIVPVLLSSAYWLIVLNAEDSGLWRVGVVLVVALGLAYVTEEIVWNLKRGGRPCPKCGEKTHLNSFRIRNTCVHCGGQI